MDSITPYPGYLRKPSAKSITYNPRDTLPVEIDAFGYLSEQVAKNLGFYKMETCGLESCAGLVFTDKKRKRHNMSHIAGSGVDHLYMIVAKTQSHYPEAFVVYSRKADKDVLDAVVTFAKNHADYVERIPQDTDSGSIGINLDGDLYDPPAIHKVLIDKNLAKKWVNRVGLKNMNRYFEDKIY